MSIERERSEISINFPLISLNDSQYPKLHPFPSSIYYYFYHTHTHRTLKLTNSLTHSNIGAAIGRVIGDWELSMLADVKSLRASLRVSQLVGSFFTTSWIRWSSSSSLSSIVADWCLLCWRPFRFLWLMSGLRGGDLARRWQAPATSSKIARDRPGVTFREAYVTWDHPMCM